ncbi:DMT family transporter [Lutibaculum baratangense]|uniref:Integral membrane protein n=1 Tax=Lutibaculum baratangense AMV1 TaxID=631454 RepID=V4RNU3_9HYPH|nr:DMT family transporter [Lutibaculum baratangense]ESR26909.1 hypothetical protein N177_0693 [Lutibaculum baratangense AMV1]
MTPWMQAGWLAVAVAAGSVLPLQAGINAGLGRSLGHPVLAATASFLVGSVFLLAIVLALRIPLPEFAAVRATPPSLWVGGLLGVVLVTAAVYVAPAIGGAAFAAAIITGQLTAGLLLDHFGVAGFSTRPVTPDRFLAIALIAAGVLLLQFGPGSGPGGR